MIPSRKPLRLIIGESNASRVDRAIAKLLGVGRREAKTLIASGQVLVEGRCVRAGVKLSPGTTVDIVRETSERGPLSTLAVGNEQPRILWQRGSVLGLYKPPGFHSHRGRGQPSVADFLALEVPETEQIGPRGIECGLVHRLDKDTSGLMLATTTISAYTALREAFGAHSITKEYLALVSGNVHEARTIDLALVRRHTHVRPARKSEKAWPATTRVSPVEHGRDWTLVAATMTTGVTHQIRAHLAFIGHPVIGDTKYNRGKSRHFAQRHMLHAFRIQLRDGLSLCAPAAPDFAMSLARLRAAEDRPSATGAYGSA